MAIDLHYHIMSQPCRAVMIVARHLGIKLNLVFVDVFKGDQHLEAFIKINPAKVVPAINDNGFCLGESRAIIAYLVNQYAPGHSLYPLDAKKRASIERVLHLTGEMFIRSFDIVKPAVHAAKYPLNQAAINNYFELLKVLDQLKGDNLFLAGNEMSIADVSFICDVSVVTRTSLIDISKVAPGIFKWIELMKTKLPEYDELIVKPEAELQAYIEKKIGQKIVPHIDTN